MSITLDIMIISGKNNKYKTIIITDTINEMSRKYVGRMLNISIIIMTILSIHALIKSNAYDDLITSRLVE